MDNVYTLISDLGVITDNLLEKQLEPSSQKEGVLLFTIAKASKTLDAIVILCKSGYGEDATILSRSLFELYWFLEYVLSTGDNYLAERFFDYDWVVRKEIYNNAKVNPIFSFLESDKDVIDEVEKKAQEMQNKYNFNKFSGWSDKSIWKISNILGHGNIYDTAYKIQCSFCHPNPRTTNDYFKEGDSGEFILDAGPSSNLVKESLISSFLAYLGIVKEFNDFFKKGFDEKINDLESRICPIIRVD